MRVLTVRQPWAWAIMAGAKTIENRTQAWSYRGPLAIHAGAKISDRGMESRLVLDAWTAKGLPLADRPNDDGTTTVTPWPEPFALGRVLGLVDMVGAHWDDGECCDSQWAERAYVDSAGRRRTRIAHLVLINPRPFRVPIDARGRLGLWKPDAELEHEIAHRAPELLTQTLDVP